jgi:hypothetical protein
MLIRDWMVVVMLQLAFLTMVVGDRMRAELGLTPDPPEQLSFTVSD